MRITSRLKKLEAVLAQAEAKLELVFVKVGQTKEEAINLKYGEDGAPDGVELLVMRFVAPDRGKAARSNGPK